MTVALRALELVYELVGVEVMLDAGVGMQGRMESTGRVAALARPVCGERACWRALGVLGTLWPGQCQPRVSSSRAA
jgi:hypothetical protein